MRSFLQKAAVWLLAAVGLGPLISKAIEKWAERNGYLDDPTKGLQWLLGVIGSISDGPYFYPIVSFLVGLALGLWADRFVHRQSARRRERAIALGELMLDMETEITSELSARPSYFTRDISLAIEDYRNLNLFFESIRPQLGSMGVRAAELGVWLPSSRDVSIDTLEQLQSYLGYVGRMLADGHVGQAMQIAESRRIDWQKLLSSEALL